MAITVENGNYKAKVVDHGVSLNNDKIKPWVTFQLENGQRLTWFGAMTGKGREITARTLVLLGLPGNDASVLVRVVDNKPARDVILNTDKEYELVVENQTWEGTTRSRVKFVNDPSQSTLTKSIQEGDLVKIRAGLNLQGDLSLARKELNIPDISALTDTDDIGF